MEEKLPFSPTMWKWQQSAHCNEWRQPRQERVPTSGAIQKGVPTEVFLRSRVLVSWAETPAIKQIQKPQLQIHSVISVIFFQVSGKQTPSLGVQLQNTWPK